MDLDVVADELYGLRPEEFVAARDRRALDARKAGDQTLAKAIGALRRPSLGAWVSNLLVRRQVGPLLALGEELRRAHRALDGPELRRLARRQSEVIGALGRQARQLAAQAGHPVGEGVRREVEETLHAALADPEAARAWAAGRLVKPLSSAFGFPEADEGVLARRPTAPRATGAQRRAEVAEADGRGAGRKRTEAEETDRRGAGTKRTEAEETDRRGAGTKRTEAEETDRRGAGKKRAEAEERADGLARRRRLDEARRAARDAERELRACEAEARAAEQEAAETGDRVAEAEQRVRTLRGELRDAEAEQRRARTDEQTARDRARQADRALREARRHAEKTAAQAERLSGTRADGASTGRTRRLVAR
ncbi:hypothetical protein GCM10010260_36040 [Streptomyces filipinensis]|uniref:Uncharacterized protein n=1 Tax=Streptomyces filipinensis TaxID=66887 RepID=A0A918IB70_9ACTN|nr:hypothetical protein [Streptomyces filipinensis]GGU97116.1 hypothetical protein GCM10010260_36040 [Streptomyces filipinensis]